MGWWLKREEQPEPSYTRLYERPWRATFTPVREVEVRGPGGVERLMVPDRPRYLSSVGYTSWQWDLVCRGYHVGRPRFTSPPLSEAEMLRARAENAGRG